MDRSVGRTERPIRRSLTATLMSECHRSQHVDYFLSPLITAVVPKALSISIKPSPWESIQHSIYIYQHNPLSQQPKKRPKMTSYPLILSSLTPREAITDALLRCFIGIDHNDAAIFDSAFVGEDIYL